MPNLKQMCAAMWIIVIQTVWPAIAADEPAAKPGPEKVMASLSQLVGGTWVNSDPNFVVENRYEWAFKSTAIRCCATIGKGSPHEQQGEGLIGLDSSTKTVFYLDCHGGNQVYKGTIAQEGDALVFEFATIIGAAAKWRNVLRFPDKDTMQFTIFADKEGKWVPVVEQKSKRKHTGGRPDQVITEAIIDAPVEAIWSAFTTKEGQESWNVAHAEIDLRIGGAMRTHYNRDGKIGDPQTIVNTILCYEPNRMLAIQVQNPPTNFPYKAAIEKMWTIIDLDPVAPSRTKVKIVGNGYGDDEESRKLRRFFENGNAITLKKLQERFAAKRVP